MRRLAVPNHYSVPNDAPIVDLNTTPLIDVMLVLLIMFIITVPIATHKVALDLPAPDGIPSKPPVIHRLNQDAAGRLAFDGRSISEAELPARLAALKADPAAELHFRTDATTRYEDFDRVLAAVKGAGITKLGLVDNARFANFDR
ncbi:MAG TPA: biopolymer transporter ExbD [Allosphingosinicella sp.]|jgi:biopolymer transport protein ExbD|uniref:ExbD/TolR family protein n=1 Tax=Allosphingosinicella sp. TaxID=2823234 RepID=UPI002F29B543